MWNDCLKLNYEGAKLIKSDGKDIGMALDLHGRKKDLRIIPNTKNGLIESFQTSFKVLMGENLKTFLYLQKIVFPCSSSENTVALVMSIICLGQPPSKANWSHDVVKLLPVWGVLPLPDKVTVVENPLWLSCRIGYKQTASWAQNLPVRND
jgi:hypothetical protein